MNYTLPEIKHVLAAEPQQQTEVIEQLVREKLVTTLDRLIKPYIEAVHGLNELMQKQADCQARKEHLEAQIAELTGKINAGFESGKDISKLASEKASLETTLRAIKEATLASAQSDHGGLESRVERAKSRADGLSQFIQDELKRVIYEIEDTFNRQLEQLPVVMDTLRQLWKETITRLIQEKVNSYPETRGYERNPVIVSTLGIGKSLKNIAIER